MNLDIFCKWLSNHGINAELKTYGETHYFYNASGYTYAAIHVNLCSKDINGLRRQREAVKKYCNRYNLDIFREGRTNCNIYGEYTDFLAVRTMEAKAEAKNYYLYRDKARDEIEELIHEYHTAGLYHTMHKELEKQLREIMDKYGSLYNQSLIKAVKIA